MGISDINEADDHQLCEELKLLATKDDLLIINIPPDIQKIILSHLGWEELIELRATNIYYRDIISTDCQDIWNLRIASRWHNGKGKMNKFHGKSDEFIEWSTANKWNIHRENLDITGFDEFIRRCRLDYSVLGWLQEILTRENIDSYNWIKLMEDGEDIIDCLEYIIIRVDKLRSDRLCRRERARRKSVSKQIADMQTESCTLNQSSEVSQGKKNWIEKLTPDDLFRISGCGKKVLTAIYRLFSYQQLKFLTTENNEPHLIETGAIALAKFYLTISQNDPLSFCIIDEDIESRLCELTNDIKSSLGNRLGQNKEFPLLEVIKEMKSIFGDDAIHKFSGNTSNYYDVKNSLLHEVLIRKTGIPITLAIVYVSLVRRVCGVQLDMIGLPGHIVIGLPFQEGTQHCEREFVDAFHGGKLLSYSDLKLIVAGCGMIWRSEMANPISNQHVWQRMIRNLINCHSRQPPSLDITMNVILQSLIDPIFSIEKFHDLIQFFRLRNFMI